MRFAHVSLNVADAADLARFVARSQEAFVSPAPTPGALRALQALERACDRAAKLPIERRPDRDGD